MKILMLVNWKVNHLKEKDEKLQSPDYTLPNEKYWFFKHVAKKEDIIDVIGLECAPKRSKIEKKLFNFYITQTLKNIFKIRKYDVVISHGAQSGIVLAFLRRFILKKVKHILIDVGAFQSASEKENIIMKVIQFASKSINHVIYHTSSQIDYYKKYFPWLVNKSSFIHYGAEIDYFKNYISKPVKEKNYILCVGYDKRDWNTLIEAFKHIENQSTKLILIGKVLKEIPDNIVCFERKSLPELIDYISNSKFCVLPLKNYNYSFGQMTLLQQQLRQRLVLVSKVNSINDYIIDGETCVVYEPENAEDLLNKMCYLIQSKDDVLGVIGKKSCEYVCNFLNEEQMAKKIYMICDNMFED